MLAGFEGRLATFWHVLERQRLGSQIRIRPSILQCRMAWLQERIGLSQLAQPLVDKILKDIEAEDGMKGVAICRLVSKSWLAAVQQYPGTARRLLRSRQLDKIEQHHARAYTDFASAMVTLLILTLALWNSSSSSLA